MTHIYIPRIFIPQLLRMCLISIRASSYDAYFRFSCDAKENKNARKDNATLKNSCGTQNANFRANQLEHCKMDSGYFLASS